MTVKIKYSKELNNLFSKLMLLCQDIGQEDIIYGDLAGDAYHICVGSSNDYRANDYAEYVDAGIEMANLAEKSGKDIYCVSHSYTHEDIIFYFVNDLVILKDIFKKYIAKAESLSKEKDEDLISNLEQKLAKLKNKKKKK